MYSHANACLEMCMHKAALCLSTTDIDNHDHGGNLHDDTEMFAWRYADGIQGNMSLASSGALD